LKAPTSILSKVARRTAEQLKEDVYISRLDRPDYDIVKGLVDKAITAEEKGLKGIAYIDSRGIVSKNMFGHFDQSLHDLSAFTKSETERKCREKSWRKLCILHFKYSECFGIVYFVFACVGIVGTVATFILLII